MMDPPPSQSSPIQDNASQPILPSASPEPTVQSNMATGAVQSDATDPTRKPYKSFRKKYQKMSVKFNDVMKQSDHLHTRELTAKRLFNRIVRENNRLLDILQELNSNEKFPQVLHIDVENLDDAVDSTETLAKEDAKYYLDLLESTFEFSSDEESAPKQKNPMGLLEWLKRNQPQVFTESLDKSVKEERPNLKKRKSEAGASAGPKDIKIKRSKADDEIPPQVQAQLAAQVQAQVQVQTAQSQNQNQPLSQNQNQSLNPNPTQTKSRDQNQDHNQDRIQSRNQNQNQHQYSNQSQTHLVQLAQSPAQLPVQYIQPQTTPNVHQIPLPIQSQSHFQAPHAHAHGHPQTLYQGHPQSLRQGPPLSPQGPPLSHQGPPLSQHPPHQSTHQPHSAQHLGHLHQPQYQHQQPPISQMAIPPIQRQQHISAVPQTMPIPGQPIPAVVQLQKPQIHQAPPVPPIVHQTHLNNPNTPQNPPQNQPPNP